MKPCSALLVSTAILVALALCAPAPGEGASCPPTSSTLCTQSGGNGICCNGPCGSNNASCQNGTSSPVPSLTVYAIFNSSDPKANCANQTGAPGAGTLFGDQCTYYVPIANETGAIIGSLALNEQIIIPDPTTARTKTSQTFFFGDNSVNAVNDTLNTLGQGTLKSFVAAIAGGTGKYEGARGTYASRTPNSTQVGSSSISLIRKDFYFI